MAIDKIFNNSSIDDLADNVLSEVDDFMLSVEKMQKRKVAGNVQLVIQALKKIDADIREKYDGVTTVIEKRVSTIKDGKDGQNGANGRDGKDGRPGRDGAVGPRGVDGLNGSNGRDGEDGVSVTNAFIDFDGSLVINLSDGQSLNVGEVVAPDLAEKIKVITNGGGTSQGVLDTLTSLQNQINLISSALVYKGTWNASTNTPALASGVGTANSFYIVSVAGTTTLDGISNWGVGDWATFNGTAWQRVEGGAAGNFTDLTVSGAATLSAGEANGVAFLNGSKVLSSSGFFTYDDTNGISLLRPLNQGAATSFTSGTTSIGSSSGTSTANPFFQFQGRNDWPLPQILRFQADYVSGADSGMGLTISSRISNGTFQNRYRLLADGTAHIWSLGATGAEQMRLTSTGLGIGTSSPAVKLDITGYETRLLAPSSGKSISIYADANSSAIGYLSSGFLVFGKTTSTISTQFTEQLRLDASGNLGLGVTPSTGGYGVAFQFAHAGNGGGITAQAISANNYPVNLTANAISSGASTWKYFNTDASSASRYEQRAGVHAWFNAASGTAGNAITFTQAMTLDASGNLMVGTTSSAGKLTVSGSDFNSYFLRTTSIGSEGVALGGSTGKGRITSNGSIPLTFEINGTEAARITSGGDLLVGTTSTTPSNSNSIYLQPSAGFGGWQHDSGTASGTGYAGYYYNGTTIGSITQTGTTAVLFNTTSDQRLKENIQDAAPASALIDRLQVRQFDWKSDGSHQRYGFVAQELVTVAPEAVHQPADPEEMMAVDYSKLVPMLVKEIQSLRQRLAALEAA